jgi:hypothetical protein
MEDWVVPKNVCMFQFWLNHTANVLSALSTLGRRAYVNFWAGAIARHLLQLPVRKIATVTSISMATYILPEDIISTFKDMRILDHRKKGGADTVINKATVKAWAAANRVNLNGPVDEECFLVKPEEYEEIEGDGDEEQEEG